MNKLLIGVFTVVAALGTGMIFLQQQNLAELRGEIAGLRTDLQQMVKQRAEALGAPRPQVSAPAVTDSSAVEEQRAELAKLRDEMKALSDLAHAAVQQTQKAMQLTQAATQTARGESAIPVKLTAASELKNVGRATAPAALETMLAAAYGGDVDTVANSIVFDAAATTAAQELFARLPAATQADYGSPEKLIALMLSKDAAALAGMQILGQRDVTPDIVGVRVRLALDDGKTKEQGLGFRKTPDGMKLIINSDIVNDHAKRLSGGK